VRGFALLVILLIILLLLPHVALRLFGRRYALAWLILLGVASGITYGRARTIRGHIALRGAHAQLRSGSTALLHYRLGQLECPSSLEPLVEEGLLQQGADRDPWGTPIEVMGCTEVAEALRSAGPDRRFGTADDIVETYWERALGRGVTVDGVDRPAETLEPAPARPRAASSPAPP
jgi:hypothetical protein